MSSKSLNIFLIDGTSTGRIKCTMQNWTGVAYKMPRKELENCIDNGGDIVTHLKQSGIYFLLGASEGTGTPTIYVGQAVTRKNGEGILLRLLEHKKNDKEKYHPYWNEAIAFTTTNNSFGPTEISYLENRFTNLAKEANRFEVNNGNDPNIGHVTEEKKCELEEFIDYAKIIMGVLGNRVFEPLIAKEESKALNIVFNYQSKSYNAHGTLTNEGFVLLSGSDISDDIKPSAKDTTIEKNRKLHQTLISNHKTTKDILFTSPSAAASFVSGSPASGNALWKTDDGKSPKDF